MATMVSRLIALAQQLNEEGKRSSALRRRAVSTAYYAVFHAIAKSCADILVKDATPISESYARVYRALDHEPLKATWQAKDSPLKKVESLRRLGELVVPLQTERNRADYMPPLPHPFSYSQTNEIVEQANSAINLLNDLSPEDCRTLAVSLLFKVRSP